LYTCETEDPNEHEETVEEITSLGERNNSSVEQRICDGTTTTKRPRKEHIMHP
jgi:hypothetical protein